MNWSCGMPNVVPLDGICKPTGWHMQADGPPFGSRHEYAENATWVAHAEWWFIKRKLQRHDFDRPKFVNKEGKDYLCSGRVAASHPTPCRGEPRHNWPTTGIYIPCLLQQPIKQHLYGLYKRIYRFRLRHPLPVGRSAQQEDDGDYIIYVNGKCVITACDNICYVKKLPCIAGLMAGAETGHPYEGAKEAYILDFADKNKVLKVVNALWYVLIECLSNAFLMRYSRIEPCVKICMAKNPMLTCLSERKYCCPLKLFWLYKIRADTSHEVSALLVTFVNAAQRIFSVDSW